MVAGGVRGLSRGEAADPVRYRDAPALFDAGRWALVYAPGPRIGSRSVRDKADLAGRATTKAVTGDGLHRVVAVGRDNR